MKPTREELMQQNPTWNQSVSDVECVLIKMAGPFINKAKDEFYNCEFKVLADQRIFSRRVFLKKATRFEVGLIGKASIAKYYWRQFLVMPGESIEVAFRLQI